MTYEEYVGEDYSGRRFTKNFDDFHKLTSKQRLQASITGEVVDFPDSHTPQEADRRITKAIESHAFEWVIAPAAANPHRLFSETKTNKETEVPSPKMGPGPQNQ